MQVGCSHFEFSDTLSLTSEKYGEVNLLNTGIAWPSDKRMKFKNPDGNLENALRGYSKPIAWAKELYQLDPQNPENNGFQVSFGDDLDVYICNVGFLRTRT